MTHLKIYLVVVLMAAGSIHLQAQDIRLSADPAISQLTQYWQEQNRLQPGIPGWRVQILASTDRLQVENAKTRFLNMYPDIPADWVHEKPYYKLQAGAFRNRLEARAFIASIQDSFTGCYPARDPAIPPAEFLQTRQ